MKNLFDLFFSPPKKLQKNNMAWLQEMGGRVFFLVITVGLIFYFTGVLICTITKL